MTMITSPEQVPAGRVFTACAVCGTPVGSPAPDEEFIPYAERTNPDDEDRTVEPVCEEHVDDAADG